MRLSVVALDAVVSMVVARTASTLMQTLAGHKRLTTTMPSMHVVPGVTAETIKALDRRLPKVFAPGEVAERAPSCGNILVAH